MLMCPAASLFATSALDNLALGPVGPYLPQNDYRIISKQILPEENIQAKVTHLPADWEDCDHQLPLKHGGGKTKRVAVQNNPRAYCNFRCRLSM